MSGQLKDVAITNVRYAIDVKYYCSRGYFLIWRCEWGISVQREQMAYGESTLSSKSFSLAKKKCGIYFILIISQWIQCQEVFIKVRGTRLKEVFWIFEGTDSKLEVSCWCEMYVGIHAKHSNTEPTKSTLNPIWIVKGSPGHVVVRAVLIGSLHEQGL